MNTETRHPPNTASKADRKRRWAFSPSSSPPKNKSSSPGILRPVVSGEDHVREELVQVWRPDLHEKSLYDLNTLKKVKNSKTDTPSKTKKEWEVHHWQESAKIKTELMFGAAQRQAKLKLDEKFVHRKEFVPSGDRSKERVYLCGYPIRKIVQVPRSRSKKQSNTNTSQKQATEEEISQKKTISDSLMISKFSEEKNDNEHSFELKPKPIRDDSLGRTQDTKVSRSKTPKKAPNQTPNIIKTAKKPVSRSSSQKSITPVTPKKSATPKTPTTSSKKPSVVRQSKSPKIAVSPSKIKKSLK